MEDVLRPQRAALRLLRWLRETHDAGEAGHATYAHGVIATPIDTLAERLGLAVAAFHPSGRRDGALGWLEPGENLIFVREGLSDAVRRFTLAHEIGHAVLHRAGGMAALFDEHPLNTPDAVTDTFDDCDDADVTAPADPLTLGDETLRPGQAYSARARRESEANAFAAALLLPADALLAAYLDGDGAQRSWRPAPRALAERFGVSEDAVLRRLAALLVPAAGEAELPVPERGQTIAAIHGAGWASTLDAWQRAAAEARTPALIVAGPGTGKTSTLVGRVIHLVREEGVPADAILALTFSNKAAREMRERLQAALSTTRDGEDGGDPFELPPLPTVSTIHAFCGDLLRRYAPLVGLRPDFRLVGATDGYFLLRQMAGQLAMNHYQPLAQPGFHFPTLLAAISRAKDELAEPERYSAVAQAMAERAQTPEERHEAERATEVATVYMAYQAALTERGDPDFGDIIRLTVRLLREQPQVLAEVRARFRHVLVDEFQDINRAMGVLLHTLTGFDGALWAVGDADQAIYRFRGASPANLTRFTADYQAAQVRTLERNYRSVTDILEAAAAVAGTFLDGQSDASQRSALLAVRQAPDTAGSGGSIVTLAAAPNEAAELGRLAEAIRERQARGLRLGDQVVLCRTRRQCQQVAAALNDAGIPARLTMPLMEQDAIKDVLAVLSLLSDMSGAGILRAGALADHAYSREDARAVLTEARARHVPPGMLLFLLAREGIDVPGLTPDGRRSLIALAAILSELRIAPDVATGLCRYVFGLTQIGRGLLAPQAEAGHDVDADLRRQLATSLAQLLTHARAFEEQRRLAESAQRDGVEAGVSRMADWGAFLEYLRVVLALRQEGGNAAEELMGDSDARVRVLTVHASKGLEFPVVYLPGLADRRFPMQRRGTSAPMPTELSEDEALEAQNPNVAHLAEEACLFYVAVTRARDELVLSYAEQYGRMRYRPSPFLAPIQQRLGSRLRQIHWTAVPVTSARSSGATLTDNDEVERASERASAEEAPLSVEESILRPSAIETYSRCPRQYAYRYVYGLRPREVGLVTLRRTLHDTLHTLQERVAEVAVATETESAGRTADTAPRSLSLEEALDIFEQQWGAMIERERRTATPDVEEDAAPSETGLASAAQVDAEWMQPLSQPFVEVYRRHGRQIIERSWARMVQRQLPGMEDVSEAADVDASAPLPEAQYDHPVVVHVGGREIAVTLDRIEGSAGSRRIAQEGGGAASGRVSAQRERGRARQADAQPVRFVRHKLGSAKAAQADLRALFYALAAEQNVLGSPAEVYDHNLTTGEMERVTLNPRKVAKLREDLDELLEGINSGIYPARPDPNMCLNCPFLFICPA